MTRALVLAVLGLLWAAPAEAHCYSIWHYRSPQRCAIRVHGPEIRALRPAPVRRVALAPPSAPVVLDEAAERAVALDALRHALNAMELIR
jgi:hypothetical protein